jgi:catechol 2,3-dioxygenase-like lactoylglutathione lyase family enzyme
MTDGPRLRAAHLVVDVTDLERAAVFWSALLGLEVTGREAGYLDLGPLGAGGPVLSFQLVPEPKAVKNRVHLDLAVDAGAGGVIAAGYRALALGAVPVSELRGADSAPWQVWCDPDGNEFCLVTEAAAGTTDSSQGNTGVGDAQTAGAR